jgi:hypothetical protein
MKKVLGLVVTAARFGVGCFGATTAQPLQSSADMPASEGSVMATKGSNGNTALNVRVKHLAPASRISEEAQVYVVWVEPEGGTPQNVGVLTVDKDLEGSLTTITPHRKFRVVITPEENGQVQEPSGTEVFTSQVERAGD